MWFLIFSSLFKKFLFWFVLGGVEGDPISQAAGISGWDFFRFVRQLVGVVHVLWSGA